MSRFIILLPLLVVVLQALTVSGLKLHNHAATSQNNSDPTNQFSYADIAQNKVIKLAKDCYQSTCKVTQIMQPKNRLKELKAGTEKAKEFENTHRSGINFKLFGVSLKQLEMLPQDEFVNYYNPEMKIPLISFQKLYGAYLKGNKVEAKSRYFFLDPRLDKSDLSSKEAFKQKGYQLGHVAPMANMVGSLNQRMSCVMTNAVPQLGSHNLAWSRDELLIRKTAIKLNTPASTLITGVIPGKEKLSDGTSVPTGFYMSLFWEDNGDPEGLFVYSKHENDPKPFYMSTIEKDHFEGLKGELAYVPDTDEYLGKIKEKTGTEFNLEDFERSQIPFMDRLKQSFTTKSVFTQTDISVSSDLPKQLCKKLTRKIYRLKRMGKLSVKHSSGNVPKTVLDLGTESFSAACRNGSVEDALVEKNDQMTFDTGPTTYQNAMEQRNQMLIATVRKRHTLRLLDFLGISHKKSFSAFNVGLKKVILDCAESHIDIHSAPYQTLSFIPGLFVIRSATFSLRIHFGKNIHVVAGMTGQWALGNIVLDVVARYDTKDSLLLLKGTSKKGFNINLKNELDSLTGTYVPIPLPSVSLTNIAVTGQIELTKGGLATVVVSGSIGRNRVHAVFQKPVKSGKFTGAFAADIGPIKLSDLIRKTTEVDISRVPFFGSLTIPRLGVTVSSEYITSSLLPNVFCKDGLLKNTAFIIPKGLQVFTVLNLRGTKTPLKMFYYKTFLSFEVVKNGRLPIGSLLSTVPGVNIRSLPLPPGIRDVFKFQIEYFSYNTSSKEMVIDTQFPGTLRYFKGYLTITKPALKVIAVLKHPRKVDFEVDGAIKIGKGDYSITISRDSSSNKYILKASFKTIPISDFLHKFSAKVLPRAFQNKLKKFIQFSIHNARLAMPLVTRNLQLHLSGTPVIGGYKTVHMSAVIIRQGGKTKFVTGLQFGKVSLATLLNKITGKNMRGIAILNQELDTSLVISPVSLPGVHLYGSKLKDISIEKGVSIHAALQWPSNCARDKFCAVAQRVLGKNAKFSLQASIQSTSSFTLSAGVSKVRLGGGVVLQRAALQIKAGAENAVGIYGEIHLSKVGITLSAGLRSGSRGVVLEGNMQGCWKRAFGAKWLSICNLHLLIAIQPTVTLVGALEIGGQVRIGNPSCVKHPLIASGYMGVDQLSPNNNFYHVELKNRVTMGTLLQAFCIKFQLPRPLANSGFPRGFLSSFSPIGKELPKAGISIPPGYRLKGTINILGLEAHADVTISLPKGVNMKLALSPLRIGGGLLQMYASRSRKRGPFLKVIVESHPRRKVDIHASGFVSVLGIQAEAMLRITNTKYEYMVRGKFLHLFQASLRITANYGNINNVGFRVRGYLKNDFFAIIRRKIKNALQSSSQAATKAIDNAKRKVNSKKAAFDRAIGKLNSAQGRVNRAKGAFDRAINTLRRWQRKVRGLCSIRRCGSVCIGCPGPWRCWKSVSVWGRRRCILKKPTWRRCCRRITDPVCITKNGVCYGLRKTALLGLKGAEYLVGKSRGILNAANAVLNVAKHVVRVAKRSLDIVNAILEGVKRAYQAGTKALTAIVHYGLGGIFDIRELSFDVALSSAATGHFRVSVLVSIFHKLKRFSLNINLRNILSFVRAIGEKVIHGLKKFLF